MTRRCRSLAVVSALLSLPASGVGQPVGTMADWPVGDGPPLPPPPAEVKRQTWLEGGPGVIPAAATMGGPATMTDAVWPVTHSGSACHFDSEPALGWLPCYETSVQVLQGAYFSSSLGPAINRFDYLPLSVRHGWALSGPVGAPGYWEFLADVTAAAITSNYGNWFAGSSLFLRYNCADPGSLLVPYVQCGAGVMLNDAYRDPIQRAIGQELEFILHAQVGVRYMIAPNLSLDVEGGVQHISNAGMANRNAGVNALGGSVGFTYYFPWGTQ